MRPHTSSQGDASRSRSASRDWRGLPPGETVRAFALTPTYLGFDEHEVATQGLISHHYRLHNGRYELHSTPFRYVWPSELDLMARLAGMRLRERWSTWERQPFTAQSTKHIFVWERATPPLSRSTAPVSG